VLAGIIPALAGAIAGWLLGVHETAYLVWSVLALAGGYFAGLEHHGAREGAIRGLWGGFVFGGVLLLVHQAIDKEPKAELPDPEIIVLAITAGIGVVAGALGGRRRARHEEEAAENDDDDKPAFSVSRLHWFELVGFAGAGILLLSLFLPWFGTDCESVNPESPAGCNPNSVLNGKRGDFNAFEIFGVLDWLLVAACVAPFILAYIIARGHELSWRPGEVTMIVGMVALALILLNGIVLGKPGDTVDVHLKYGYLVGLLGALLIMAGGTLRQAITARARKPPGVM
jgi:peptidoglycan/LPS O-acetylase OafA/YrhL